MNILFAHQNMPGQFKHLARHLAAAGHGVAFVTKRRDVEIPGVRRVLYEPPERRPAPQIHPYLPPYEDAIRHGQQVVRACQGLRAEGFRPDLLVAHPGWGEALFLKEIFPAAPLLSFCEFYYQASGSDVDFDPAARPVSLDTACRIQVKNAHLLASLVACDRGWSPTVWQKTRHPAVLQPKIAVIFDGIDTRVVKPAPAAGFRLPDGRTLTRSDEVVTYVARNLEPYRGFPSFVRALPEILRRRPGAEVVIVGGDGVSYGRAPPAELGATWREAMLNEVALDPSRVHFLGNLPYNRYLALLQVSTCHVYLTYPFVLSWSMVEALAAGCAVVGSRTPPVEEVIVDGENGYLVDFFSPQEIAERTVAVLAAPAQDDIRRRARDTVLARYDLARCLPAQLRLFDETAGSRQV